MKKSYTQLLQEFREGTGPILTSCRAQNDARSQQLATDIETFIAYINEIEQVYKDYLASHFLSTGGYLRSLFTKGHAFNAWQNNMAIDNEHSASFAQLFHRLLKEAEGLEVIAIKALAFSFNSKTELEITKNEIAQRTIPYLQKIYVEKQQWINEKIEKIDEDVTQVTSALSSCNEQTNAAELKEILRTQLTQLKEILQTVRTLEALTKDLLSKTGTIHLSFKDNKTLTSHENCPYMELASIISSASGFIFQISDADMDALEKIVNEDAVNDSKNPEEDNEIILLFHKVHDLKIKQSQKGSIQEEAQEEREQQEQEQEQQEQPPSPPPPPLFSTSSNKIQTPYQTALAHLLTEIEKIKEDTAQKQALNALNSTLTTFKNIDSQDKVLLTQIIQMSIDFRDPQNCTLQNLIQYQQVATLILDKNIQGQNKVEYDLLACVFCAIFVLATLGFFITALVITAMSAPPAAVAMVAYFFEAGVFSALAAFATGVCVKKCYSPLYNAMNAVKETAWENSAGLTPEAFARNKA